jgi:hypothetical protein
MDIIQVKDGISGWNSGQMEVMEYIEWAGQVGGARKKVETCAVRNSLHGAEPFLRS